MREVATISNNNITLSDNMKSAVSAIIFASIISITTGETTVPTPYPTYATFPSYAPIAPTATCTGSTAGWVDVDGADTVGEPIIGEPGSLPNDNCCFCSQSPKGHDRPQVNSINHHTITYGISAISVLALQIAILRNPKLRSNTFNLYLVFCLAPDAFYFPFQLLYQVLMLVEYCRVLAGGEYWPNSEVIQVSSRWGDWYWLCASLWMSLSVFVQIYRLLMANKQAKRYQPPTRKRVIRDSMIIHIFSGIVATVKSFYFWMIEKYWSVRASNMMWWIGLIPVVFIPTLLITGMCFGVWWSKLLPRKNARYRSLTMFFARLIASAYLTFGMHSLKCGAAAENMMTVERLAPPLVPQLRKNHTGPKPIDTM